MEKSVSGSCLCKAVRFSVSLPTLFCGHCHCSICRRSAGAAFVTWFGVPRSQFRFEAGESALTRYASSEHATRFFCSRCGSLLGAQSTHHPDQIEVVLASLEGAIDRAPEVHIFHENRVSWVTVEDDLPKLPGAPEP